MRVVRWPWQRDTSAERRKIEDRLAMWAGVIDEIERGYDGGIDDYTNDLDLHVDLHERCASLRERDPLRVQLTELEARYEASTRPVEATEARGSDTIRVPLAVSGELAAGLRARGWT